MWSVDAKTEDLLNALSGAPSVPASVQHIGSTEVGWWEGKPGEAIVMAQGGSPEDRWMGEQIVTAQLERVGYKRALFTFDAEHKTAGWPDIMEKAKRLIQSNQVTLLRNGYNNIVAHVVGDHGEYNCEIGREDPESRTITQWQCECPWDQYAWQRTRKWKKYEGRPCAHVMAAYWKALATPLDDYNPEEHGPMGTGQKQGEPAPPASGGMGGGSQTPAGPPLSKPGEPVPTGGSFGPDEALGTSAPMAPPGQSGILPTPPVQQLSEMQPPIPGATPGGMPANPAITSVPGAKMPSPFNPIQFPGGTYSSAPTEPPNYREGTDEKNCAGCKMNDNGLCWGYGNKPIKLSDVCDSWESEKTSKVSTEEAPMRARLKVEGYGIAEGKSEAHGAGQYRAIPAGTIGEVLGEDPTTGWIEVLFPLHESSYLEPYHVRMFCEPGEVEFTEGGTPFVQRRT